MTTEIVTARIIAAFACTGLTPISADRMWSDDGALMRGGLPACGCAVGAVALDEHPGTGTAEEIIADVNDAMPFGVRTGCVEYGWDDAVDANVHYAGDDAECPYCERPACRYYEAGATAAVAMGVA